ncbi:MAG: single-stranded DNA-binding protein [Planctomycetota bacterium]|nr:single-stranded DNA-binding protein [Planctomycetota bacterium]
MPITTAAEDLLAIARACRAACERLPLHVPWIYSPWQYAWPVFVQYAQRYFRPPHRMLWVGMNPGPFGMVQSGIPFGDVALVRSWLQLDAPIVPPAQQHPRRPIVGWSCARREVSGQRLWGLLSSRYRTPQACFAELFVINWCPLAFLDAAGRNLTPDRLPMPARQALGEICDRFLAAVASLAESSCIVALGAVAAAAARRATALPVLELPHPSPANPRAQRGWTQLVSARLHDAGLW